MLAAAYELLAGSMARSAGRWMAYLAIVARQKSKASSALTRSDFVSAPLARVFQQFIRSSRRNFLVEQFDEGVESDVFMVRSRDGHPLWETHRSLVISCTSRQQFQASRWRERNLMRCLGCVQC